ncbi:unnamed protein product [Caenorhabditis sp. 36 PRJEB53466]|nr:unnamed protein product [Caenorhabditis sp. 36 PRJEB53466]
MPELIQVNGVKLTAQEIEELKLIQKVQLDLMKRCKLPMLAVQQRRAPPTADEQLEIDGRSVFVGNLDARTTIDEIEEMLEGFARVKRVTISQSGRGRAHAFVELGCLEDVHNAIILSGMIIRGQAITICPKWSKEKPMADGPKNQRRQPLGNFNNNRNNMRIDRRFVPY